MSESKESSVCDLLVNVLSGECTEAERLAFETHLLDCPECRQEFDALQSVWEVLSVDMDRLEPPKDLKQEVLNAAFAAEPEVGGAHPKRSVWYGRRWVRIATAAVAFALLAGGTWWNIGALNERSITNAPLPIEQALSVSAANIERLVPLKSVSAGGEYAYGVVCIVDNGQSKQFVTYVFGAKPTAGEEAYQVWLIRDNVRTSAGTFRVDEQGIGVLAMPIEGEPPVFDAIGITLEPDDRGAQPRGTRTFAS
jgi:hypothetical protein